MGVVLYLLYCSYRGEETPNGYPDVNSHFGSIDMGGFEKDRFYYYQAIATPAATKPILHLFPDWNAPRTGSR